MITPEEKEKENDPATTLSAVVGNRRKFNGHHHASTRIKNMNASLTKSRITIVGGGGGGGGGGDHRNHKDVASSSSRRLLKAKMKEARLVEKLLFDAVDKMKRSYITQRSQSYIAPPSKLFPSVRQCNAALATFGDAGEFRRALTLFAQMKKSASLFSSMSDVRDRKKSATTTATTTSCQSTIIDNNAHSNSSTARGGDCNETNKYDQSSANEVVPPPVMIHSIDLVLDPPKPTLVTYSTLMSRAVSLGKPRVALRLWNLMRNQPNFYTKVLVSRKKRDDRMPSISARREDASLELKLVERDRNEDVIVPDVIFCNTLMNAYAKLGEHVAARSILNAMLGADGHEGIPRTAPTAVTYNTLADACKVAGELGAALEVPELMMARADATGDGSALPDARTYTILISTVARKKKNDKEARDVRSGGENDPDMAFALLNRMINEGITRNYLLHYLFQVIHFIITAILLDFFSLHRYHSKWRHILRSH